MFARKVARKKIGLYTTMGKRKYVELERKQEIAAYIIENPGIKRCEVGRIFSEKYEQIIPKSVLGRIYQTKETILKKEQNGKKKFRGESPNFPEFEEALTQAVLEYAKKGRVTSRVFTFSAIFA